MSRRARAMQGKANIGCIVWLAILGLVGYALYKIVPVKIATSTFYDTMQEQASFGSIKGIPQIEYAILQKARELELPDRQGEPRSSSAARKRSRSRPTTS